MIVKQAHRYRLDGLLDVLAMADEVGGMATVRTITDDLWPLSTTEQLVAVDRLQALPMRYHKGELLQQ